MVSITTEYKVASVFQALSNGEKDIEISRQVLAERSAFEPYTAFKRLTRLATSALTVYQVVDFLRENDFHVLEKDVRNVFRQYSSNGDGRLSYTDFLELVLPRNNTVLREICTQRESYPVADDEILPYEVELGLAKIFDKEVNLSRKCELLREDLASRFDFNLRDTYELLVEAGEGRVDFDAFYNFLQKNNISVVEKDVVALLRRIDTDRDGRVNFSEYSDNILAVDSYYRSLGESRPRSPTRVASPSRVASPKRVASPYRSRVASPSRIASPTRSRISTNTESRYFSPTAKKLTNYDYISYLSQSAKRSTLRKSAASSPARKTNESVYQTPTRTRVASPARGRSPVRHEVGSPMKGNEEEHLATALKEQVELDKELEQAKNKLALQDDFNLFDAFRFFDQTEKGYVTRLQLKDGLNDFHVFPTTNELYLIMKKYNKDADGLLKYSEFCELLKSKDLSYSLLLTERKPSYADKEDIGFRAYTVELAKKVFNQIIENEYHSEKIRQRLSRRPLFDHYDAFEALDKNRNGFISKDEFRELLADHGFYATQKELKNLMERYDANEDGKVSYTEFVREITPKSPERV